MTDTNAVLRDAAARIRTLADAAANDRDDDVLCCWADERLSGTERVIEFRQHEDGNTQEVLVLASMPGVAPHVAAWDPVKTRLVATLLEVCADLELGVPAAVHHAALEVARALNDEREHATSEPVDALPDVFPPSAQTVKQICADIRAKIGSYGVSEWGVGADEVWDAWEPFHLLPKEQQDVVVGLVYAEMYGA